MPAQFTTGHSGAESIQVCRITGAAFKVTAAENSFLRRLSALSPALGAEFPLPETTACEALRQICAWGNIWHLYRSRSSLSGAACLTRYDPAVDFKIATMEEFWSDAIDNTEVGAPYDFSRPFFDQFGDLLRRAVYAPLSVTNVEGSDYVNGALNLKDCYLCFAASDSRDCLYCYELRSCESCIDCVAAKNSRFCFSSVSLENCYECRHCADCWDCSGCFGCWGCRSCSDCIGCVGLTQARYCIFNQQHTQTEYDRFLNGSRPAYYKSCAELLEKCRCYTASNGSVPNRIVNAENCSGDYIWRSQNLHQCYNVGSGRDCGYLVDSSGCSDCWRGVAIHSELCWNSLAVKSQNIAYTYSAWVSENILYSYLLYQNCRHCFGCTALKGKSYCILNRQYTKAEYFDLLPRIVAHLRSSGEWGRFLPARLAPHGYQESYSFEALPALSQKDAAARGYRNWSEAQSAAGKVDFEPEDLPELIDSQAVRQLSGKITRCRESGASFNLQRAELELYSRLEVPAPRLHWRRRLRDLSAQRARMPEKTDCTAG